MGEDDAEDLLHHFIFAGCLLESADERFVDMALSFVLLLQFLDLLFESFELLNDHLEGGGDDHGLFLEHEQLLVLRQVQEAFVHDGVFVVGERLFVRHFVRILRHYLVFIFVFLLRVLGGFGVLLPAVDVGHRINLSYQGFSDRIVLILGSDGFIVLSHFEFLEVSALDGALAGFTWSLGLLLDQGFQVDILANVVFKQVVHGVVLLTTFGFWHLHFELLHFSSGLVGRVRLLECFHFLNISNWALHHLRHWCLVHLRPHLDRRLRQRKGLVGMIVLSLQVLYGDLFGSLSKQVVAGLLHLLLDDFVGVLGVALPLDLVQQVSLFSEEENVLEDQRVSVLDLGLVEVVHVQLADEAAQVVVLEELGQH